MSAQDFEAWRGSQHFTRLGEALDGLTAKGYYMVHEVLARGVRSVEGSLKRDVYPVRLASDMVELVAQVEALARFLPERVDPERVEPDDDANVIKVFEAREVRALPPGGD